MPNPIVVRLDNARATTLVNELDENRSTLQAVDVRKLTNELRAHLDRAPEDALIEVVLEIHPGEPISFAAGTSRQRQIAAGRQQFLDTVAPVEERIQRLGGKVLDHAWLNHTLRARVPARIVDQLTEADCVASVDMPGPLSRE